MNWWMENGVSYSSLGTFLECQRKKALQQDGWRPKSKSQGLAFGTMGHEAMEVLYGAKMKGTIESLGDTEKAVRLIAKHLVSWRPGKRDYSTAYVENRELWEAYILALIPAYGAFHAKHDDKQKWIGLESKIEPVPFHGTFLKGRLDYVYRAPSRSKKGGGLWIMDSKFKSRVEEENLLTTLDTDPQLLFYMLCLAENYGEVPVGAMYNVVRRPGLRMKKTEKKADFIKRVEEDIEDRPEHYFLRYEVAIDEDVMQGFANDLKIVIDEYDQWMKDGAKSRKYWQRCRGKFGTCEFYQLCHEDNQVFYIKEERKHHGKKKSSKKKRARIVKSSTG